MGYGQRYEAVATKSGFVCEMPGFPSAIFEIVRFTHFLYVSVKQRQK